MITFFSSGAAASLVCRCLGFSLVDNFVFFFFAFCYR